MIVEAIYIHKSLHFMGLQILSALAEVWHAGCI
jgi:hypothetical protein